MTAAERVSGRIPREILWIAAALLLAAASYHLGWGFYDLAWRRDAGTVDLRLRWVEQRYIVRLGQDPFDVYFRVQPERPVIPPRPITRAVTIDPELGPVLALSYPPWSYVSGSLLWWPSWPQARWWMALVDALALALIAAWAYRTGRRVGTPEAVVVALLSLGCSHYFTLLCIGQLAIVVMGCLVAALLLDQAGYDGLSGLTLGIAMIKPTIALPFLLVPLVRGRWVSLAAGTAVVGLSAALVWIQTGVSTLEMCQQMTAVAEQVEVQKGEPGVITWLIGLGLSPWIALRVDLVAFLIPCAATMWACRRRPVGSLYAIAAVTSQLFTHHQRYDEVLLVLLVVPLVTLALDSAQPRWLIPLAAVVAVSVLELGMLRVLPNPNTRVAFQTITWLTGLIAYLASEPLSCLTPSGLSGHIESQNGTF